MFHKHLLFDNWIGKNMKMYRYVAILEIVDWKAKIVNKSIKQLLKKLSWKQVSTVGVLCRVQIMALKFISGTNCSNLQHL